MRFKYDVKSQVKLYRKQLQGRVVICPCNDRKSQFTAFIKNNFDKLGISKLISIGYKDRKGHGSVVTYTASNSKQCEKLTGDGSCFSPPVISYIEQADIVITNPPFSLFNKFLKLLFHLKKQFLILGPLLAVSHKDVFSLIQNNQLFIAKYLSFLEFSVQDTYEEKSNRFRIDEDGNKFRSFGNICWYTNLNRKIQPLELTSKYTKSEYPIYDNKLDAIEVSKVNNIPSNYYGIMGVPITFLALYCPEQFKIVGFRKGDDGKDLKLDGKTLFSRVLIQRITTSGYSKYNKKYKSKEKHSTLKELFPPLPKRTFEIIYADPPWDYGGKMQFDKSASNQNNKDFQNDIFISSAVFHYPTLKLAELKQLKIQDIANQNCCLLFLWTTGPMLNQALELGTAWGFEYKTVAFV